MTQQQAIVMGGSIAGLLASRVLSDFYDRVIILDRDRLPVTPQPRRGVPQSVQPHVLFTQGYRILEDFFPKIGKDLQAAGAVPIDWGREFHYFNQGAWNATADTDSELVSFTCTRPLLEATIRQRLQQRENVEFWSNCRVIGLEGSAEGQEVSGVRFTTPEHPQTQIAKADLVVDASGRGSLAPSWLKALGMTPPPVTRVDAHLGYATRRYRIPENAHFPWKVMLIAQEPPDNPRLGYLAQVEDNQWISTLGGYERDYPPLEDEGFLNFARSLADSEFYDCIRQAEPLSELRAHRATANRLYHYEKIKLPRGFVALGDAVCALCPVYGQGMTVSALSAEVLANCLEMAQRRGSPLDSNDFQKRLARNNAYPWSVAVGQDSAFPSVQSAASRSNPFSSLLQGYFRRLLKLSHQDGSFHVRFMAIAHMVASPLSLFHPRLLWQALVKG